MPRGDSTGPRGLGPRTGRGLGYCPPDEKEAKPKFTRARKRVPYGTKSHTQGYCVKCRAKREMVNPAVVTAKRGRLAMTGYCPVCDTKMYRFLPKDFKE